MDTDIENFIPDHVTVQKDAIHVPVLPIVAATTLYPGQRIVVNRADSYGCYAALPCLPSDEAVAIVSPFLDRAVHPMERCWALVLPGKVTKLRHDWQHPGVSGDIVVSNNAITASPLNSPLIYNDDDDTWCKRNCY